MSGRTDIHTSRRVASGAKIGALSPADAIAQTLKKRLEENRPDEEKDPFPELLARLERAEDERQCRIDPLHSPPP